MMILMMWGMALTGMVLAMIQHAARRSGTGLCKVRA